MLRELNVIAWMVGVEFRVIKRKKERKKQNKKKPELLESVWYPLVPM